MTYHLRPTTFLTPPAPLECPIARSPLSRPRPAAGCPCRPASCPRERPITSDWAGPLLGDRSPPPARYPLRGQRQPRPLADPIPPAAGGARTARFRLLR